MVDVPVLVVGAGPVGLTAALLLARRGVPVHVVERHPQAWPLPRAVHLDDEAFRVLQAAGVADDVAARSRPVAGLRLLDGRLRVLAEFPRDPARRPGGWPPGSLFHQPDLEQVLRDAVALHPSIRSETGVELVGLLQDGAGVDVRLRAADRSVRSVRARWLLGCDGAGSTVRELVGARLRELGRPDRWLVVDGRAERAADAWPGVHQVADPARAATFLPVTGDLCRWEFRLAPRERADDLRDHLAPLLEPFGVGRVELVRAAEYVFRAAVADRWRTGRVLLAGDAAHLTPPFIGQALGLGLRDVHQLAWRLTAVLGGAAVHGRAGVLADDELLDGYQAEREPHARALIGLARLLGALMTGGGRGGDLVRRPVLAAVRRLPAVVALGAGGRTPPLRDGALVDRRRAAGRRLAGSLLHQPDVVLDGAHCRLDDVLGQGWADVRVLPRNRLEVLTIDGRRVVEDPVGAVAAQLAGAAGVRVRPDRIVQAVLAAGPTGEPAGGP